MVGSSLDNLSFETYSKLTVGYISSDIEFIINEASKKALMANSLINDRIIIDIIKNTKPSISNESLIIYNNFKNKRFFN